jgi:hypothetical protein
MALGPTQLPIQWVPGALPLGVEQLGHEADHSPSFSAEIKGGAMHPLSNMPSWHGAQLKRKDRDNFTYIVKMTTVQYLRHNTLAVI